MPDAGKCLSQYQTCFGTVGDCSDGTPECCALLDCVDTCDFDLDGAIAAGEELDCVCTNDGVDCVMEPPDSTTCFALHAAGLDAITAYQNCVYGACSGC
jgi:hypothetical protein